MTVDPKLLELLVCPACRRPVALLDGDRGIECRGCGRIYPVRGDIPIMLVSEATPPRS